MIKVTWEGKYFFSQDKYFFFRSVYMVWLSAELLYGCGADQGRCADMHSKSGDALCDRVNVVCSYAIVMYHCVNVISNGVIVQCGCVITLCSFVNVICSCVIILSGCVIFLCNRLNIIFRCVIALCRCVIVLCSLANVVGSGVDEPRNCADLKIIRTNDLIRITWRQQTKSKIQKKVKFSQTSLHLCTKQVRAGL